MPDPASSERPDVSIVTVNYKVADLVGDLIRSVPDACGALSWEIIVVDNASEDGSVERLRREHPHVRVIASDANLGFGRGNNLGVEHSSGAYLALVNPDVVLPRDALAKLIAFLKERPRVGLVGPRVQLPDGSTQSSPRPLPDGWDLLRALPGASRAADLLHGTANRGAPSKPQPCGVVHGSCMIFRREAYEAADGMARNIFMYGEEPIIGHRVKEAGYEVWYDPTVHILHQDEASADKRWIPHQKALRKRNGHISAHSEIWPRSWSLTWNALMAARELSRVATTFIHDRDSSQRHLDFARLHLSGMKRVKGDASNSLPD
jgi:GT2 family glycosyltransferase